MEDALINVGAHAGHPAQTSANVAQQVERGGAADTRALVDRLAEQFPSIVSLGEEVSLAVRIEPRLLRAARLQCEPALDAAAEADLWFSPLVESRTANWIVLVPGAAHELRRRLACDPERLNRVRRLIERAHAGAPAMVALEEQILWLATAEGEAASEAIDRQLRPVLSRLAKNTLANISLARWFVAAAPRLPAEAAKTEAYSLLCFVASALLDGRSVGAPSPASPEVVEALAGILPGVATQMSIWVALTERGLAYEPRSASGFVPIELPRTDPLLLSIRVGGRPRFVHALPRNGSGIVLLPPGSVTIETAAGDVYTLMPRHERPFEAPIGSVFVRPTREWTSDLEYNSRIIINEAVKMQSVLFSRGEAAVSQPLFEFVQRRSGAEKELVLHTFIDPTQLPIRSV